MAKFRRWTREETIIALYYYFQIPYGQLMQSNPKIIQIAKILDRTPSSVSMKMGNLARFDKDLHKRGVYGLTNGSKMDYLVWHEFYNQYGKLLSAAETALTQIKENYNSSLFTDLPSLRNPSSTYGHQNQGNAFTNRDKQDFFNQAVLAAYDVKCCMTGIAIPELISACHIKPVEACETEEEKLTPQNGLCLNALFRKAFQTGLISIRSDKLRIIVSPKLKNNKRLDPITKSWLVESEGREIIKPLHCFPQKLFLEYHNDVIFNNHS